MKNSPKHLFWGGAIWMLAIIAGYLFFFSCRSKVFVSTSGRMDQEKGRKTAYLTFDDGPSNYTGKLLDILKEEGVKATFFVVGKEDGDSERLYRRMVKEGHSLGLHSFSHVYSKIYSSQEMFEEDLWKLKTYLYHVTGVSSDIYRFPGGSGNSSARIPLEGCVEYLRKKGIEYYDWNSSAEDAVCVGSAPDVLMKRVLKDALKYDRTMILMHDLNSCKTTLDMVRPLILRLRKEGYSFEKITKDTEPVGRQLEVKTP